MTTASWLSELVINCYTSVGETPPHDVIARLYKNAPFTFENQNCICATFVTRVSLSRELWRGTKSPLVGNLPAFPVKYAANTFTGGWRQRGRVVSVSDSQSSSAGFESRSDHYLDLFLGSPKFKSSAMLVNSQLVYLRPVGILNNVMFNLNYLFQLFARPH